MLERWAVRGVERVSEGSVKGRVSLVEGPPARPERGGAGAGVDRLVVPEAGYYAAEVKTLELPQDNSQVRVVFDVSEGRRVVVGQVIVDGNTAFRDKEVVEATCPPGPKGSGGSARGSTTRTRSTRTSASGCRAGTPTRASSTSRSPATR